jgi:hypothetical protein
MLTTIFKTILKTGATNEDVYRCRGEGPKHKVKHEV